MCKSLKRLAMIATVLAAAIIPAAASARPVLPDLVPYSVSTPAPVPATPTARQVSAGSAQGFSWHDAAFGAAGMLVLMGVGSGTLVAVRRRALLS